MKKSPLTLALLLAVTTQAQTLRRSVVDNFGQADSLSVIMTRGGLGPAGHAIGRVNDTLGWVNVGAGGATSVDSITGLGTGVANALKVNVGSAGAFVTFNGAGGTPSSLTLTNATGLPRTSITGLGTSVATALGVNVGTAGSFVVNGGALGTPSSGTLTNATGLPISTGVSGLGANVATFLATPSSANLRAALTDEVGTGAAYFVGGALGTPASVTLTNGTGLPLSGLSGLASGMATWLGSATSANLRGTLTDETGTGVAMFNISPNVTGVMTAETIVVDSLNAGKFSGALDADSAVFAGLNAGYALTVNGSGKLVDNSVIRMGAGAVGFYNTTPISRVTLDCPTTLADFNPVTNTEDVRACLYSIVTEFLRPSGLTL